ncbi:MAG TPA: homoserine O-acetyltransferase [Thermoanaerobaculaceae bacterium]|nr:homoserine O-acetyltransferase [Thermoanaerobaculaceae bacterium]HRS14934.1 homoserine O-acetyltransferase [Thermoanaerobaculaceae bacterium]
MRYRAHVSPDTRIVPLAEGFELECGAVLPEVEVAYRTWGRLTASGDNAVLVCHALTGSADVDSWWGPLLGPGRALDTDRDFIVCSNVLGSCYGTTGPASRRPGQRRRWGPDFPPITVRDMVRLQARLLDVLGVRRLRLAIGGSLGGMQVLEWAATFPERVEAIVPVAAPGRHSAWAIGLSEAQRAAIEADPLWEGGRYRTGAPPAAGLAAARMLALCTYRSWESFTRRFGRAAENGDWAVARYLRCQGDKLVDRFDANCYVALTRAMDSHDLGRGRGEYGDVLRAIRQPALIVAIDSDALYPPEEQWELAERFPNGRLAWLHSPHGHDAFLIETEALARLLTAFRAALGGHCTGFSTLGLAREDSPGHSQRTRNAWSVSSSRLAAFDAATAGRGGARCAS